MEEKKMYLNLKTKEEIELTTDQKVKFDTVKIGSKKYDIYILVEEQKVDVNQKISIAQNLINTYCNQTKGEGEGEGEGGKSGGYVKLSLTPETEEERKKRIKQENEKKLKP